MHYVQPECDEELGVAHGVQPTMLRHVLEAIASEGKQVGAVLVVSPTYFGACSNMSGQQVRPLHDLGIDTVPVLLVSVTGN